LDISQRDLRKYDLLHFGYVAQWESFRGDVISRQVFLQEESSLPKQLFFHPRFTASDCGRMWMLIKGYINQLCGETPSCLRMGVPAPKANFVGMSVTETETQRKAAINAPYQSRQEPRKLMDWLEMQP
jgi:hypothetical protein